MVVILYYLSIDLFSCKWAEYQHCYYIILTSIFILSQDMSDSKPERPFLKKDRWQGYERLVVNRLASINSDVHRLIVTGKAPDLKAAKLNIPSVAATADTVAVPAHRNPVYGEDEAEATMMWNNACRVADQRRISYDKGLVEAWVFLDETIDDSLRDKIRLDEKYQVAQSGWDVKFLWEQMELVSDGNGTHSMHMDFTRLVGLSVQNNSVIAIVTYWNEFSSLVRKIVQRKLPIADFMSLLFNGLFISAMMNKNASALRSQVDEVIGMSKYPGYDDLISKWNLVLTSQQSMRDRVRGNDEEGKLAANKANIKVDDNKKKPFIPQCFKCGQPGHRSYECSVTGDVICASCGGAHLTSMCAKATAAAEKRNKRKTAHISLIESGGMGDEEVPFNFSAHVTTVAFTDSDDDDSVCSVAPIITFASSCDYDSMPDLAPNSDSDDDYSVCSAAPIISFASCDCDSRRDLAHDSDDDDDDVSVCSAAPIITFSSSNDDDSMPDLAPDSDSDDDDDSICSVAPHVGRTLLPVSVTRARCNDA